MSSSTGSSSAFSGSTSVAEPSAVASGCDCCGLLSSTGNLIFFDVNEAIAAQAARVIDPNIVDYPLRIRRVFPPRYPADDPGRGRRRAAQREIDGLIDLDGWGRLHR